VALAMLARIKRLDRVPSSSWWHKLWISPLTPQFWCHMFKTLVEFCEYLPALILGLLFNKAADAATRWCWIAGLSSTEIEEELWTSLGSPGITCSYGEEELKPEWWAFAVQFVVSLAIVVGLSMASRRCCELKSWPSVFLHQTCGHYMGFNLKSILVSIQKQHGFKHFFASERYLQSPLVYYQEEGANTASYLQQTSQIGDPGVRPPGLSRMHGGEGFDAQRNCSFTDDGVDSLGLLQCQLGPGAWIQTYPGYWWTSEWTYLDELGTRLWQTLLAVVVFWGLMLVMTPLIALLTGAHRHAKREGTHRLGDTRVGVIDSKLDEALWTCWDETSSAKVQQEVAPEDLAAPGAEGVAEEQEEHCEVLWEVVADMVGNPLGYELAYAIEWIVFGGLSIAGNASSPTSGLATPSAVLIFSVWLVAICTVVEVLKGIRRLAFLLGHANGATNVHSYSLRSFLAGPGTWVDQRLPMLGVTINQGGLAITAAKQFLLAYLLMRFFLEMRIMGFASVKQYQGLWCEYGFTIYSPVAPETFENMEDVFIDSVISPLGQLVFAMAVMLPIAALGRHQLAAAEEMYQALSGEALASGQSAEGGPPQGEFVGEGAPKAPQQVPEAEAQEAAGRSQRELFARLPPSYHKAQRTIGRELSLKAWSSSILLVRAFGVTLGLLVEELMSVATNTAAEYESKEKDAFGKAATFFWCASMLAGVCLVLFPWWFRGHSLTRGFLIGTDQASERSHRWTDLQDEDSVNSDSSISSENGGHKSYRDSDAAAHASPTSVLGDSSVLQL